MDMAQGQGCPGGDFGVPFGAAAVVVVTNAASGKVVSIPLSSYASPAGVCNDLLTQPAKPVFALGWRVCRLLLSMAQATESQSPLRQSHNRWCEVQTTTLSWMCDANRRTIAPLTRVAVILRDRVTLPRSRWTAIALPYSTLPTFRNWPRLLLCVLQTV